MILIHAHAQRLRNGMPNPKTYPWWPELITTLDGRLVQVAAEGDPVLVEDCRIGLPLKEIAALLKECAYFITVDSFLQHLAQHVGRAGVVLWSKSDPLIFGYPENLNLLKDRRCLRRQQFRIWEEESYDPDTFLPVGDVVQRIGAWRAMALPVRVAA